MNNPTRLPLGTLLTRAGATHADLARVLGITLGAVRATLRREGEAARQGAPIPARATTIERWTAALAKLAMERPTRAEIQAALRRRTPETSP